jgi:hypothetical protein
VEDNGDGLTIRCRIRLRVRGGERIIEASESMGTGTATRPDWALIKAVVRAHAWREALEQGAVCSTAELAAREGCHVRYVRNVIKLAFLAPDLIETVLDGTQSRQCKLAELLASDLLLSWLQQRSILAAPGKPPD